MPSIPVGVCSVFLCMCSIPVCPDNGMASSAGDL